MTLKDCLDQIQSNSLPYILATTSLARRPEVNKKEMKRTASFFPNLFCLNFFFSFNKPWFPFLPLLWLPPYLSLTQSPIHSNMPPVSLWYKVDFIHEQLIKFKTVPHHVSFNSIVSWFQ